MRKIIIHSEWRCGTIGIVAFKKEIRNEVSIKDGWCAYIGITPGTDKETDEQYVIDWGTKLTKEEAVGFFPILKNKPYDY